MSESNSNFSRRSFLRHVGIAGAGAAALPLIKTEAQAQSAEQKPFVAEGAQDVRLNINGKNHDLKIEPRVTLLDALRENLQLTGTKKGCDHGQCGACTIHVNGQRVNSCLSLAIAHQGDKITTIEGLGTADKLHPMQKAFAEHDAYQCGYCTSGQIMSACALLKEPIGKKPQEVRDAMSGNICRCGAYKNILAAIQQVRGS